MTRPVRLSTNGNGYEQIRALDPETGEYKAVNHHRLLLWAWGRLDSPWFADDAREVHHSAGVEWCNLAADLAALTPREHRERDPGRARIRTPWDGQDLDGRGSA